MTLLSLKNPHPVQPSAADILFHALQEEFKNPDTVVAVKFFFELIRKLKLRTDIAFAPGRRWNKSKAEQAGCSELLRNIVKAFKEVHGRVHDDEMVLWLGLLESEFMMVGPKGQDHLRRTLYCLHTPKGSIPLDQPLGISQHALLQRKQSQPAQARR